jgi:nucleoside-diphosphate-sugar epimerase/predicted O-methyltransferase YrrM
MKILITGTTGFIGKSLKESFEPTHEIVEYIRGTNLTELLEDSKPTLVINCAGEIYNADLMYETNVGLVKEILDWIKNNSTTRLIQIGSSAEYGPVDRATNEHDPINPVDVYQATKGAATLLCQGYARQFGIHTCVARIYSGFGPNERDHRLFPRLYRAFFENEPIEVFDGEHDFIYIDDFVRGIDILMNSDWPSGEIVNFGSGRQYSNLEVVNLWIQIVNHTAPIKYSPTLSKPYESKTWVCDTSYAKEKYGFSTEYNLETGIRKFISIRQGLTTVGNDENVKIDQAHVELIKGLVIGNKPRTILEFGLGGGAATDAILEGLEFNHQTFQYVLVDNWNDWYGIRPKEVDEKYGDLINIVDSSEKNFVFSTSQKFDFIMSDGDHYQSDQWFEYVYAELLNPGGILIYHDINLFDKDSFPNLVNLYHRIKALELPHHLFNRNSREDERCQRGLLVIFKD